MNLKPHEGQIGCVDVIGSGDELDTAGRSQFSLVPRPTSAPAILFGRKSLSGDYLQNPQAFDGAISRTPRMHWNAQSAISYSALEEKIPRN